MPYVDRRKGSGGSDGTASRLVSKAIVGNGTIPAGKLLSFDDVILINGKTEVSLADKDDLTRNQGLAWSLTGGNAGETIDVLEYGLTSFDTSGGVTKQLLYLGNDGDVLFDKPSSGVQQVVGIIRYSSSDGDFIFNPELSKEITPGGSPTKNQSLNGTGVVRGGVISILSGTQLAKTEGFGEIIFTDNASGNTAIGVAWDDSPYTADLSSDGLFVLLCDETGTFSQIANDAYTSATRRDFLTFGAFTVSGGAIVSVTPFVISSNEPVQQLFDLLACLGTIRCSGLNVSPNGTNMQFNLSSGVIHAIGSGSQLGGRAQNLTTINGQSPVVFDRLLGKTNNKPSTSVNVIDPDFYDNGTGSPVSIGGANKATIKYIFLLPSPNVSVVVMYGQTVYNSLADAVAAGADDGIVVPELYAKNALLVGRIAVASGAADLSDPTKAKFLGGAKFGSGLAGGGSGGSGGGGDVIGAASSITDGIATYADGTGKVIKSVGLTAFEDTPTSVLLVPVNRDLRIPPASGKYVGIGAITMQSDDRVEFKPLSQTEVNALPLVAGSVVFNSEKGVLETCTGKAYGKRNCTAYQKDNASQTTLASANAYAVGVIGNGGQIFGSPLFNMNNIQVNYTGSPWTGRVLLKVYIKTFFGNINDPWRWDIRLAKNGSLLGPFTQSSEIKQADRATLFLDNFGVTLNNGDYIQLFIKQISGVTNDYPVIQNLTIDFIED